MTVYYTKDPQETLDYEVDWTRWLNGDTITLSEWFVPTGITKDTATVKNGKVTVVWLLGGTLGVNYELTNRITTLGGRVSERSFDVRIRSK
jgi:hypothetical protein